MRLHETFATVLLATVVMAAAGDMPQWKEIRKSADCKRLIGISEALLAFESAEHRLPDNLGELIKKGICESKELFWKRADGSVVAPIYYPGSFDGGRVVLRLKPEGKEYTIFVRLDGSSGAELAQQTPNKPAHPTAGKPPL